MVLAHSEVRWPLCLRRPEVVNQFAQFFPLLLGKPFGPQKRRHQGNDGAVAQSVGQRLQPTSQEVLVAHQRAKAMRPLAAVALDASLGFQPLDELLHGRHFRVGDFLMEDGR